MGKYFTFLITTTFNIVKKLCNIVPVLEHYLSICSLNRTISWFPPINYLDEEKKMDKVSLGFAILTSFLAIIFLMEPIAQVTIVNADPYPLPHIQIWSPKHWEEKTYQTSTIPIEVQIDTPMQYSKITKIYCILDLNLSSKYNPQKQLSISNPQSTEYLATGTLRNLSNGPHTLDAYAVDTQGKTIIISGTRNFLVNATSVSPTANSEQPLALSHIAIALVIATIAIITGASLAVLAYKRRKRM